MSTVAIGSIVAYFEEEHGIVLSKLPRKKIIYEGCINGSSSIVVIMPTSTIYPRGNGWVDFTEIQLNILKQYKISIAVFRLSDTSTYYVNMNDLFPLMTEANMMENSREGNHWKLDIWPNKIVFRNGGQALNVQENNRSFIYRVV